jgi:hypothetical protein
MTGYKLDFELFDYPLDLLEFVESNHIVKEQIVFISISRFGGNMILFYYKFIG